MNLRTLTVSLGLVLSFGLTLSLGRESAESRRVTIAFVNDIHAQLEPHAELFWSNGQEEYVEEVGGLARLATAVSELRQSREGRVLFIDGGDTIQGSGPAAWSNGQVVVEPMNSLGLDVAVPGNWAVAYGADALADRVKEFSYPWVAANLKVENQPGLFQSYIVKEVNGLRLAVVGYTDPDVPTRQPPFMSQGLQYEGPEILQPLINRIRLEERVDIVVLLTHVGLPKAVGLAKSLSGVDIVLSADTHERTYEPIVVGETWVVEAGAFASFLGVLDLEVEQSGTLSKSWELVELRPGSFPEDPVVKQVVDEALRPYRDRMGRVIGESRIWLSRYDVLSTSLDRLISDAIRSLAGTDIALSNGYRFAPPTAPGTLTEADLWNWLPLELPLKTGETTGRDLLDYWERELEQVFSKDTARLFGGWLARPSNMAVLFDSTAPAGSRVRELKVGSELLRLEQNYTVSAGLREGAPGDFVHRLRSCQNTEVLPHTTHDAVRAYLKAHNPLEADEGSSVRCLVLPSVLRSQFLKPSKP